MIPIYECVDYMPITQRPTLVWPGGNRLAVIVVVNVEHYEFLPPHNPYKNPYPGVPAPPDNVGYSYRDYGNRVGIWRMLEVLDRYPVQVTASLNVEVLGLYPEIREVLVARDWCLMSHGQFNTRYLYGLSEAEERAYYRDTMAKVEALPGQRRLRGQLGPSFTASENSLRLMAEAGMTYTMDWFIDDQPFLLRPPGGGELVGVPYSRELNDAFVMPGPPFHAFEADYFEQICKDQFDLLLKEGAEGGRVMTIALHPFYLGLPHQIAYLERTLDYICGHEGVWFTTPEAVADHYLEVLRG